MKNVVFVCGYVSTDGLRYRQKVEIIPDCHNLVFDFDKLRESRGGCQLVLLFVAPSIKHAEKLVADVNEQFRAEGRLLDNSEFYGWDRG